MENATAAGSSQSNINRIYILKRQNYYLAAANKQTQTHTNRNSHLTSDSKLYRTVKNTFTAVFNKA